jgi:hypothetical protein
MHAAMRVPYPHKRRFAAQNISVAFALIDTNGMAAIKNVGALLPPSFQRPSTEGVPCDHRAVAGRFLILQRIPACVIPFVQSGGCARHVELLSGQRMTYHFRGRPMLLAGDTATDVSIASSTAIFPSPFRPYPDRGTTSRCSRSQWPISGEARSATAVNA